MEDIILYEVTGGKLLDEFAVLPFELYKDDKAWVPPIISEYKKYVCGIGNSLCEAGPHVKMIAKRNGKTIGRILFGIDEKLNDYKKLKVGYISQFECIEDYEAAKTMLDAAKKWFSEKGMDRIKGPLSLPGGEDNRGFITDNFKNRTYIMNTYNKEYYNRFFIEYGFVKYWDCYAYHAKLDKINIERYMRLVPLVSKRYGFHVDKIDLKKNIKRDADDIHRILLRAEPEEWEDFMPMTRKEIDMVLKQLIQYADSDLIFIARTNDGKPIGFNVTLPDYNDVLKHLNGKIFPFGIFKFFYYKRKMNRIRTFVLFVDPEYHNKGVSAAIYANLYHNACKKGYTEGEGSTIWEYNIPMITDIEKTGAVRDIVYRIYQYRLK
ncbi:hypothetical protein [Treponema pedis]|uniref:hypothetical protein n=1 Tax=Treponema pedis TaxID=409322 RepID=UPI00197EAEA0|nr:hypothetical protein [Treponema pedis]QSI05439.1 hypothetical protein DYQ05_11190 [Treponema pedis]